MDTHVDEAHLQALLDHARDLHEGSSVHGVAAATLGADDDDVAVLQTAASLENLAVSVYTAALALDALRRGNATVLAFVTTTRNQHADHAAAFNAAVTQAGGAVQTNPDPRYDAMVQDAPFDTVADVIRLASTLEDAAAQTYVRAASLVGTPALRTLFVSVAAVEAQHRAVLLAVGALLAAEPAGELTLHPTLARLPAAIGSVGFPAAVVPAAHASPPGEGALR
ncbi:MAG: ferritin-like domain-containing protein [Mycobacteriales bacterium]